MKKSYYLTGANVLIELINTEEVTSGGLIVPQNR